MSCDFPTRNSTLRRYLTFLYLRRYRTGDIHLIPPFMFPPAATKVCPTVFPALTQPIPYRLRPPTPRLSRSLSPSRVSGLWSLVSDLWALLRRVVQNYLTPPAPPLTFLPSPSRPSSKGPPLPKGTQKVERAPVPFPPKLRFSRRNEFSLPSTA